MISPVRGAGDATLFGSQAKSTTDLGGLTQEFQNGWLEVFFTSTGAVNVGLDSLAAASSRRVAGADGAVTSAAHTLRGLPVTGFVARSLRNGTLQCNGATCQGNYGAAFPIRSVSTIAEKGAP